MSHLKKSLLEVLRSVENIGIHTWILLFLSVLGVSMRIYFSLKVLYNMGKNGLKLFNFYNTKGQSMMSRIDSFLCVASTSKWNIFKDLRKISKLMSSMNGFVSLNKRYRVQMHHLINHHWDLRDRMILHKAIIKCKFKKIFPYILIIKHLNLNNSHNCIIWWQQLVLNLQPWYFLLFLLTLLPWCSHQWTYS